MSQVNGVSSRETTVSPLRPLTVTGVISAAKSPASTARKRTPHGFRGERILLRAREVVLRGRGFGKAAHELAVERALQPVVEHVIEHFAVTHAIAAARLRQQVRRIGHGFEPARERDLDVAGADLVRGGHDGLQPRAAHLVQRGGRHGGRHAGAERSLARGRLAEARRQHAAEDRLPGCPSP